MKNHNYYYDNAEKRWRPQEEVERKKKGTKLQFRLYVRIFNRKNTRIHSIDHRGFDSFVLVFFVKTIDKTKTENEERRLFHNNRWIDLNEEVLDLL